MNHKSILVALMIVAALRGPAVAADFDLSDLRNIPVFQGAGRGRIMPWDSYARWVVKEITNSEGPTLMLHDAVSEEEFNSSQLAAARKLFPDDKPRTFEASELLLSWLFEPQTWEYVPFLFAGHEDLRSEYFNLPTHGKVTGERLKYVSPHQIRTSKKFAARIEELRQQEQSARERGGEPQRSDADARFLKLWRGAMLFQHLVFNPQEPRPLNSRVFRQIVDAREMWRQIVPALRATTKEASSQDQSQLSAWEKSYDESLETLQAAIRSENSSDPTGASALVRLPLKELDPQFAKMAEAARGLSGYYAEQYRREFADKSPDPKSLSEEQKHRRSIATLLAGATHDLAKHTAEAHVALYDNGGGVFILPSLNAAALERERDVNDDIQPWIGLNVIRYGSPEVLRGFPMLLVKKVREDFDGLARAYAARDSLNRTADIERSVRDLTKSLRELATAIQPTRANLVGKDLDQDLLTYTAYPDEQRLGREVHYNVLNPFKRSAYLGGTAAVLLALAFGAARKPMFWLGMLVSTGALAWTAYGLYLRVLITEWAPVTNLYTTMIWVPFVILSLGMWFSVLPVTWPAIRKGWRLSAMPGTWEATPLTDEQTLSLRPERWNVGALLLILPRVLLMALVFYVLARAPYAAGERTIINLLPNYDAAHLSKTTSSTPWLTWAVGMCVLWPAVWFLPRVALALLTAPGFIIGNWRTHSRHALAQVYPRKPFLLMAAVAATVGWIIACIGATDGSVLNERFSPLQPVLRDNFWLTIHVLIIVSSYGAGLLAWSLGLLALGYCLCGKYREPSAHVKPGTEVDPEAESAFARRPPDACAALAGYLYKTVQVAVIMLASGTILGGLWADVSWGRFWGWDSKEVWALISLLVYLAILHGRYAGWFGNFGLIIGSQLGAWAIIWAWYGMNIILPGGLHAYGGGEGTAGKLWVLVGFLANVAYAAAATVRYVLETRGASAPQAAAATVNANP